MDADSREDFAPGVVDHRPVFVSVAQMQGERDAVLRHVRPIAERLREAFILREAAEGSATPDLDAVLNAAMNEMCRSGRVAIVTDEEMRTPEPAEGGWRPIETAPKDGTRVLLASYAVRDAGARPTWSITAGFWLPEFEVDHWDDPGDRPVYRGAWTDLTVASWGYQELSELAPTHWRPLPPPPSTEPATHSLEPRNDD